MCALKEVWYFDIIMVPNEWLLVSTFLCNVTSTALPSKGEVYFFTSLNLGWP